MATSHEETIKTKLYQNWIKSGLGLKYLKEGLQPFVTQVIKDQHKKFVERLQPCSSCSLGTLLPDHALKVGRNCSLGCDKCLCIGSKHTIRTRCQSNVCGKIYDKIVMSHFFGDPNFSNTDITKWVEDPWELAKCYINAWGYKDKMSAEDTDCLGILSIVINDTEFYSRVDPTTIDICKKVRSYRNDVMHSSNLEVKDANLRTYIEDMIAILNDRNQLTNEKYAKAARTQLQKLLDQDMYISTSDEISVIHEAQRVQASRLDDLIQALDLMKKENREQFDCIDKVQDCLRKAMDNDQQKLAADIEQIKKDLESLKMELKDNCIQKIQDILQRLESEKLKKAEDKLKEHLKYLEDKNHLREKLFEMYEKHLSTRPISPVLEEVCAHVGDIYVDLVICDHIFKEQHEHRKQRKIGVESYRDIFFRNDKQCFDIYMLGDAGMGKTTWCVKLVNDWVKVSKNTFNETRNSDLQCFEVVILVFLRNATEEVKILDMIKEQLFSENTDYYDILTAVLKQEPQKCLVIADGLDEWKMLKKQVSVSFTQNQNIPSKEGLNGCPLLITSRISKIYDIRLKENEFDRCVKIEGIKEADKLAEKIINELNKLSDDKVKKQFKDFHDALEQIRLKPFFASLPFADKTPVSECMNVPLLLVMSVCIWFQYGKIEPTLAGIYCEMFKYLFDYACSMKKYEFACPRETSTAGFEVASLPKELKNRIPRQCVDLILKMSKFAFDRLFKDCDESPQKLVFDEKALGKWFSSSDLQAAIESGILSKSVYVNQPLKRTASMSFLHKSFQEFLSAVHIVSQFQNVNMDPLVVFKKYCCNYEKLIEMENMLLFVCGFEPRAASQMSLHVQTIAKQILQTETKFTGSRKSDYLIKNLPLKCTIQVHENNKEYPSTQYPIHIETLSLSSNDIVQHCLAGNMEYIYYMFMSSISKIITVQLVERMNVVISQRRPLTVGGLKVSQPYIVSPLLQHCRLPFSLKECVLEYLDLSQFSAQQLLAFGKSLKQLTSLESLKLSNVNCSSFTLCLQNCRLKSLKLKDTNIEVKANVQKLKTLVLGNCSVQIFKELQCHLKDNLAKNVLQKDKVEIVKLNCLNTAKQNTQLCVKLLSQFKYIQVQITTDCIDDETIKTVFENKHFEELTLNLLYGEIPLIKVLETIKNKVTDANRKSINLKDNRVTIRLQWDNLFEVLDLTCLKTTKQETQHCVKLATSNCDIKSVKITTDSIDDETVATICENKHFETRQIELLKGEIPLVKALDTMTNKETYAHTKLIKLQDKRVTFQLLWNNSLTCLNTTKQETQRCVKLVTTNCDIKSVQITTDSIDDETIASLLECGHLNRVRIKVLQGEVSLVQVIEIMMTAETYTHMELVKLKDNRVTFQLQSNNLKNDLDLTCLETTVDNTNKNMNLIRCRRNVNANMNLIRCRRNVNANMNRRNRKIFTLQVDEMFKGLLLTCLNSTVEETRYVCKLVKSYNAIVSVDVLTESIDDKTFADLIACDHLEELSLSIIEISPNQREKLSTLLKDSKFRHFYDNSNGNWKITSLKNTGQEHRS